MIRTRQFSRPISSLSSIFPRSLSSSLFSSPLVACRSFSSSAAAATGAHDIYRGFPVSLVPHEFVPASIKARDVYCFAPAQGVRHIILNRPKAFNALSLQMIRDLNNILDGINADKDVYMVVMTGAPSIRQLDNGQEKVTHVFCAGGDVKSLYQAGVDAVKAGVRREDKCPTRVFFKEEYAVDFKIANMRVPFVAVMNGTTFGGGVGVSVHSRYRAATPATVFAMPECDLGFFPDVGGSYILSHLSGQLGVFLALTGHRLVGYDLVHAGLATHFCSNESVHLLDQVMQTVGVDAYQAGDAVERLFGLLEKPEHVPHYSLAPYLDHIDEIFQYTTVEDILLNLQKITSDTNVSEKTRAFFTHARHAMERASPLMLKVTLELLKRGATKSLPECLEMEYRATQHCMEGSDFYTGVYQKLIAKDNKTVPAWAPAKLSLVTPKMVAKYFDPPADLQDRDLELKLQYKTYKEPSWLT